MPLTQLKKYLIDGDPATASELIAAAACINISFAGDWLKSTSVAAAILRENGQTVTVNHESGQ